MKKANPERNIERLCQLFNIAASTYYYQPHQKPEENNLISIMRNIHTKNFNSYGRRRMKVALHNEGVDLGVYKVASLMEQAGIVAKVPKKPHYYPSGKQLPNSPNLLKRKFNPKQVNTRWVGDIIDIRSDQGWRYLATVLDLASREIVGYARSQTPDAALAKRALLHAIQMQQPNSKNLMFHSDQGVQYTATLFKNCLSLLHITQSMRRQGNCWDNAVQERFFRSLKSEYLNELSFVNHQAVTHAVEHYIRYYNNKRLCSVNGYITPAKKRQNLLNVA